MARTYILTSDISGDSGARTITLGVDGRQYEIDITPDEYTQLMAALNPYLEHARSLGKTSAVRRSATARLAALGVDTAVVRAWAREQGLEVPERGRLPQDIITAYLRQS